MDVIRNLLPTRRGYHTTRHNDPKGSCTKDQIKKHLKIIGRSKWTLMGPRKTQFR